MCCNILAFGPFYFRNMALVRMLMFVAFLVVLCQETKGCVYDSDCQPGSEICCDNYCVEGSSCVGQSCSSNSDCGDDVYSLYCCADDGVDGICSESCVGYSCSLDSDCGEPGEYCCYGSCQTESCFPVWGIVVIVLGSLAVFGIIPGGICCWCCLYRNRSTPGRLIVQPPPRTTVVTGSAVNYGSVYPHPSAPPPPYYQQPNQKWEWTIHRIRLTTRLLTMFCRILLSNWDQNVKTECM
jgi:hypothetical protein